MKSYLTALFTIVPFVLFAQSNYHPGYVLKNNGDTLKGYINYSELAGCPRSIDFKINKNDQELKFDPHTIKGFAVNGLATFVTYKGIISMDKTKFPDLPPMLDTSKKLDTIFLKQLATGKHLTLFVHQDEVKIRFFVAKDGQVTELKYYQYYSSGNQPIEKNTYKGQLIVYINELAANNRRLNKKAENAGYNEGDLEEIISKINGNSDTMQTKPFFRLFAGFGIGSSTTKFSDGNHSIDKPVTESTVTNYVIVPLNVTKFATAVYPKASFGIDLFANPDVQRLVFRTEIGLAYAKGDFRYEVLGAHGNAPFSYSFSQYSAALSPQILYYIFNKNDFKFYIDGGVGINFPFYTKASESYDRNSSWSNLPIQAGIVLNRKLEFSFTYAQYSALTISANSPYSTKNSSMSAGFKYLFGK